MKSIKLTNYGESVSVLLDEIDFAPVAAKQERILIKPNLINAAAPPITTPVACCEAIVKYIRQHSKAHIIIAEGCGEPELNTDEVFDSLGYRKLAAETDVELIDLNNAPLVKLNNPACPVFPEMYLPEIAMESYLLSVPVLKAHSLAGITGSLKNMIGLAPPKHYSGRHGSWRKAVFHGDMQQSIIDLNNYRTPDCTLMDCSIGMPDFHLGGRHCDPPVNRLLAGYDPREIDRHAAELLNIDWKTIGHLL